MSLEKHGRWSQVNTSFSSKLNLGVTIIQFEEKAFSQFEDFFFKKIRVV